ncbi:MAG: hypothetical protein Q9198_000480 [Flavoplaca austrocitrina]
MSSVANPPRIDMATVIDNKHYRARRHSLMHPPSIFLPERTITVESPFDLGETIWKPLARPNPAVAPTASADLTPSDIHAFCNRDTILYMPYPYLSGLATQTLCKAIHRSWHSRRRSDTRGPTGASKPGCWFAKGVVLTGYEGIDRGAEVDDNDDTDQSETVEAASKGNTHRVLEREKLLVELVRLHECLVEALERVVGGTKESGVFLSQGINPRESPTAAEGAQYYRLRGTLRDCFVVVEVDVWESDGVLVVWRGDILPAQLGGRTVLNTGNDDIGAKCMGGWGYKKVELEQAISEIMAAGDL